MQVALPWRLLLIRWFAVAAATLVICHHGHERADGATHLPRHLEQVANVVRTWKHETTLLFDVALPRSNLELLTFNDMYLWQKRQ